MRHPAAKVIAARASLAPLLLLLAGGCVTTYTPVDELNAAAQLPLSLPVSIPIASDAGGGNRLLLEFYSGILRRLQEAADDGNVQLLDALVESYDKPGIPESIAQHLSGYRAMARGIRFSQHVLQSAALELRSDQPAVAIADGEAAVPLEVPPLGSALQLQLRVSPMAEKVVLGGSGDSYPIGFSVSVTVEDEDVDGSTNSLHTDDMVWLPESFELASGNDLLLPIEIAAAPNTHYMHHASVSFVGDVGATLQTIGQGVESKPVRWPAGEPAKAREALAGAYGQNEAWGPAAIVTTVRQAVPRDAVITIDSGAHRILASQVWESFVPHAVLQSTWLCTMGCALPLATGAKIASPERAVIAFTGDAGLEMILGELVTLRDTRLPVIVVVFVDTSLALIELKQRAMTYANAGVDFPETDFAGIAEKLGGRGVVCEDRATLEAAIREGLTADTFTLCACRIDRKAYDGRI